MPTSPPESVLIVGAGVAGIAVAEGLRRHGFTGVLTIVGEEHEAPYDRPPLSKQVLSGAWGADRIQLLSERRRDALAADWRLGTRAVSVEPDQHVARLDDGSVVAYDELVVATGVRPRTLPTGDVLGVHVLRTQQDAGVLGRALRPGRRLVVIGGGFLGLEVAATARQHGVAVTVVEQDPEPLTRQLGAVAARRLLALHRAQGVDVRLGVTVSGFDGRATERGDDPGPRELEAVQLSDGSRLPADAALVAIGCVPCVDWLQGTSLRLDDGVVCDQHSRAAPGIWAAGDVAQWHHVALGRAVRFEHRMNATDQGRAVAANIMGADEPYVPTPYFWTDHYDVRIQGCGSVHADPDVETQMLDLGDDSFVVEHRTRDRQTLVGALAWNAGGRVVAYRREIEAGIVASAPS